MQKSPSRMPRKLESTLRTSRDLMKKENHQRVMQLVKTARENGRKARLLASLINLTPKRLSTAVVREFQAAAKGASKAGSRKPSRIKR